MSPITTWEGAEAYFVFADSPALIWLSLLGSVAACVYTIVKMASHEAHCAKAHK
ncbi:hypothetical protein [Frigidibacter sp. MR17.24]|uniref:hypothetical protein n=1 Tax=Frigidibacter sp. MR17.24 TaxID=3127345 RepID=UPI003012B99D